ncbi:MAG: glucose-6-phosphate isomerase [Candidatus Omnitrophica bacterium]|nr:glucose-6-phosphate isomerase [Candidatus Omnitrophota bacterium]
MNNKDESSWLKFQRRFLAFTPIGLSIDISRMNYKDDYFETMKPAIDHALSAMKALEDGAIANPDENRMVGHYWLRNPAKAPNNTIRQQIESNLEHILQFAAQVHSGAVCGANGPFQYLLVIGIGGSALGPQFVSHALGHPNHDKLQPFFIDNTDADGIEAVLNTIPDLGKTLCLVVSKSGKTIETRNGMLETKHAYEQAGITFEKHAVAITGENSQLDQVALHDRWLARFPMWDWVGGRTSEFSAVGLLPAALQGIDITAMLAGAHSCDELIGNDNANDNPAIILALMWFYIGNGHGDKAMVVLPYKDRLLLFSRYLQQLVMESLGKESDLDGKVVHQGITVYGNKGSTDQHAYVQQLRDGLPNFFVTFISVLNDGPHPSIEVEPGITSGDYLHGFLHGTKQALYEKDRESMTLTINEVSPFSLGVLIALYERAVGFYAPLVNINAYHQPGVEAGKKAAAELIALQKKAMALLRESKDESLTLDEIANRIGAPKQVESLFRILEHLAANPGRGVRKIPGPNPFLARYRLA